MKTYCTINLPNKDVLIIVHYGKDSTAHFRFVYNSISGGYMGLMIETFVDSFRGLLNACPDFLQVFDSDYRGELKELGFKEVPPTEKEVKIFTWKYINA